MPDGAEKKGQARGESVRGIRFAYWGAAGVTEPLKPRRPDKAQPPSGNGVTTVEWFRSPGAGEFH